MTGNSDKIEFLRSLFGRVRLSLGVISVDLEKVEWGGIVGK